jgi:uncharacterized protein
MKNELHAIHGRIKKIAIGIIWFILDFFIFAAIAFAVTYPSAAGYVNDYADIISDTTQSQLESKLSDYEVKTGKEVVVVTIKSLEGEPIEDYAVSLFEKWGIGKAKEDNGVLFLIAQQDRLMRIEVGYGLEGELTDGSAGKIIRDIVSPKFKGGDFTGGISDGVDAILSELGSQKNNVDTVVGNNPIRKNVGSKIDQIITALGEFIFFIPMVLIYLSSYMARTKDILLGGAVGGVGGLLIGLLIGSSGLILALAVVGAIFGTFLDWILSRNYKALAHDGYRTGWFPTYGGFGGSKGFGGFGGGRSGGGGASGGW